MTPRYDQLTLKAEDRHNKLQQVLSPNADDEGVWIHQDAWFHLGTLDKGNKQNYQIRKKETEVCFAITGEVTIAGQPLSARDGLGMWILISLT